jgi:hypothetical protein
MKTSKKLQIRAWAFWILIFLVGILMTFGVLKSNIVSWLSIAILFILAISCSLQERRS